MVTTGRRGCRAGVSGGQWQCAAAPAAAAATLLFTRAAARVSRSGLGRGLGAHHAHPVAAARTGELPACRLFLFFCAAPAGVLALPARGAWLSVSPSRTCRRLAQYRTPDGRRGGSVYTLPACVREKTEVGAHVLYMHCRGRSISHFTSALRGVDAGCRRPGRGTRRRASAVHRRVRG